MSDNDTPQVSHTCAVTGEESGGKHYILRSTEGEELVAAQTLFPEGDSGPGNPLARLAELEERVAKLEKAAAPKPAAKKAAAAPAKSAE